MTKKSGEKLKCLENEKDFCSEIKIKAFFIIKNKQTNKQKKNRLIHFHINSTSVIRPVKRNELSFFSIEYNKPLLATVHSVSQFRFKFKNQF